MVDLIENNLKTKPGVVKVITITQTNPDGSQTGSLGSGFLVSKDGIVVSNSHVVTVDEPKSTIVKMSDGSEKKCVEFIHRDKKYDFVILKLEEGTYPFLDLGDYEQIQEGEKAYFCGYPLRSDFHTIHGAKISSKFSIESINILQIDGSVNSGNSGGPILNLEDKVVGITTKKAGGIDDKLIEISNILKNAPSVFTLGYTLSNGKKINIDPNRAIGEVISIIHDYTSVGIGYAYSIEYAKSKLQELNLL